MKIPVLIPEDSELLIKKGQKVDFDTPFIRKNAEEEIKIPLASSLDFNPDKIFVYLHKFVGDKIEKGELLAEKKSMMSSKQYVSEFSGTIKEINHYDGSLTIVTPKSDSHEVSCFFKGEIEEIEGNTLIVKVGSGKQYPLQEATTYFGGKVLMHENSIASHITEDEVIDRVVVAEKLPSYDQMKMEALGAVGLVLLHAPDDTATVPVALLKDAADLPEIIKSKFTCCNIGPDHTTIYFYD